MLTQGSCCAEQEAEEPPEFAGLLYWDGLDALGRPVIVVNADAVAEDKAARRAALDYMLHLLEPIVVQVGDPVLVWLHLHPPHAVVAMRRPCISDVYRRLRRPHATPCQTCVRMRLYRA